MFSTIKVAGVTVVKGIGAAVVLGAGFTLGSAVTRAALETLSRAADSLTKAAAKKEDKKKVHKVVETTVSPA